MHRPADVLARGAHAGEFAVEAVVVLQVVQQQAPHLGHQRRRKVLDEALAELSHVYAVLTSRLVGDKDEPNGETKSPS